MGKAAIKPTHLTDYLEMHSRRLPDKPAIVCEDRQLSWSKLEHEVLTAASELSKTIKPSADQQVVQILLPNGWQFVVAYLAILKLGHIALPLDPAYKKLELGAISLQVPAVCIISDDNYVSRFNKGAEILMISDLLAGGNRPAEVLRFDPAKQIASLTFTSGTTGQPKAVPNTHANHIWNIKVCSEVWDWTEKDSLLNSVPLSHMLGIVMGLSGALYHGNTLYLHEWFDERKTLEALASGNITLFSHAASAYIKLLQVDGANFDLSAVRLCISGAAALPPAVWQEFKRRYGIEILETYGSSETGRIAGNRLDERVLGSPGKILPGVSVQIDKDGEILVKSGGLFPGYYKNPQATRASQAPDGYWRTGDIGEIKNGNIYLKGRRQERIRRFGYTISPRDVEWALLNNPKIKDAYVMGNQRSDQPNDELIYFIVGDIGQAELNDYAKENLLFAWRPDKIIHLDDLPRTASGKPRISSLKQLAGRRRK